MFGGRFPTCSSTPVDADFSHVGPCDHGALFDFGFPSLAAGASQTFTTFYGVAPTEAEMFTALGSVGAESVYSFGQFSGCNSIADHACETFAFGFKGVGGTVIGTTTPEPATFTLLGTGLMGIGGFVRRRRRSA